MFMNKRRKRKRQIFYHHIELVYNNPTLVISEELRQALLNSASGLEKGDDEVLHRKANRNDELLVLKKYLERKRWRYYWGVILQVAFTNH